ncbi:MAG TPA: hypothetical protein VNU72_01755 [Puia sp.]|nr:hypothetical protein [Puia sp.]
MRKRSIRHLWILAPMVILLFAGFNGYAQTPKKTTPPPKSTVKAKPAAAKPAVETTESVMLKIRSEYNRINGDTAKMRVVSEDLSGQFPEGGKIRKYYTGDTLRKASMVFYGETGKSVVDYYYLNRELFFSYEHHTWYDRHIGTKGARITKEEENRLYFNHQKLFRWADHKGKVIDKSYYPDKENDLMEVMKVVRA